uniref:Uncharacterized protein n=1 Tax=Lotus japonicus TaxID=34305 RepID=I3SYR2_LOTJA|nr:unknown [Lotus japonicus]
MGSAYIGYRPEAEPKLMIAPGLLAASMVLIARRVQSITAVKFTSTVYLHERVPSV